MSEQEQDTNSYISASQQRLLAVLAALADRPLESFDPASLARATGASYNAVFRDLKNLEAAGWAEQCLGGWRIAPKLTRFSEGLRLQIAALHHTYLGDQE